MLKLQEISTFTTPVTINAPGGAIEITVDFVHMSRDERQALVDSEEFKSFSEADLIMKVARGWGKVDLAFSREAVDKLCSYYPSASVEILTKFFDEMNWQRGKQKN